MGRAGGGGGHSGGGHSMGGMGGGSRPGGMGSGRSGGGHSMGGMGGGSRPGGGGSSRPDGAGGSRPGGGGGPRPGGPGGPPPGPRPPRHGWMGGFWGGWRPFGGYGYGYRGGCGGCVMPFIVLVVVIVIVLVATGVTRLGNSVRYGFAAFNHSDTADYEYDYDDGYDDTDSHSTAASGSDTSDAGSAGVSREKLDTGVSFSSDCVLDELGWIENPEATGESLKTFYDATGIQPYVYFKAYDASLTTDSEKEEYAFEWYEENIDNEGTFLYMYFAEEDSDNDIGYMVYVNGYDIDSVMDEEAIDIFWDYVDEYWYSNLSTDDMLTEIFTSTADAIMNE